MCPSNKEPFPGWVDSVNGPIGMLAGASLGILRSVHGRGEIRPDLLPVDYAVNAIIAVAVSVGNRENGIDECRVFNCTTGTEAPITFDEFLDLGRAIYKDYPSTNILWYPGGKMHEFYLIHLINFICFQFIPALFYDGIQIVRGKKPVLVKLQKKIYSSLNMIHYFLNNQWEWDNKNLILLYQNLDAVDKYVPVLMQFF